MPLRFLLLLSGLALIFSSLAQAEKLCVNDEKLIQQIIATQKAYKKNKHKYDGYRAVIGKESNARLTARLIYAETLAANCSELNNEILPGIAEVIGNRIRIRNGDAQSVIFQRDQFASSLNSYSQSRMLDFLCPKDKTLWSLAEKEAERVLTGDPVLLPKNAFNYYLYLHAPNWPVVDWADRKKHQPVKTSNFQKIDKCVRFFNHLKFN